MIFTLPEGYKLKKLIEFWKLPVGTVVEYIGAGGKTWQYHILSGNRYMLTRTDTEYFQIFDNLEDFTIVENVGVKVIIPYGYQSPLWKVLNGEEL